MREPTHESPAITGVEPPAPSRAPRASDGRVRSLQFTEGSSILELGAQRLPTETGTSLDGQMRVQIRLRAIGLMAHSELACGLSAVKSLQSALGLLAGGGPDPARLTGQADRSPALAVEADPAGGFRLTLLGLNTDPRISFVAQDWHLSEQDLWRMRQWLSDMLA
jgi:hypothetical protein